MRAGLCLGLVLACLGLSAPVSAHQKSVSYSRWLMLGEDEALAQIKVRWLELTSLPALQEGDSAAAKDAVLAYLQAQLRMEADGVPCEALAGTATWLPAGEGWARAEWRVRCPGPPTTLRSELFQTLGNHVHLATVRSEAEIRDLVLSPSAPTAVLAGPGAAPEPSFGRYLRLGVEHILTGWDHLAFLFLLIVVATRLRQVALLVTGFTVGHSVTLAAAALGFVVPHARTVEATIAASILVVALENLGVERLRAGWLAIVAMLALFMVTASIAELSAFWGLALFALCYFWLLRSLEPDRQARWFVACLFGLVHGLGFSTVLLEQALPATQLVTALLGFNLGVELGQLAVVLLVWPLLTWLRRRDLDRVTIEATSFAGVVLGTYALVWRAFS